MIVIKRLKTIKYDSNLSKFDLSQTAPCDDRLIIKLTLEDYDWMKYTVDTYFPTIDQGMLSIHISFFGCIYCEMEVKQRLNNSLYRHVITFSTELFAEFMKTYLSKHIQAWDEKYAFCGDKEIIEFYNNIIKNYLEYNVIEKLK